MIDTQPRKNEDNRPTTGASDDGAGPSQANGESIELTNSNIANMSSF